MKITKVDVMQVKTPNPSWRPILCRVYTDEGIYGDGEAALAYGIAAPAAFGMIRDLAALIIGMDPLDNEVVWDTLYKNTFWGQNGGPVVFAGISAIDFALWDIRGKFFNVPVYNSGKRSCPPNCIANCIVNDKRLYLTCVLKPPVKSESKFPLRTKNSVKSFVFSISML